MSIYYADSSALVKRYVVEAGSDWMQSLCDPADHHLIALAHIGLVEIAAALGIKTRQGFLLPGVRDGLLQDMQRDAREQYWLVDVDQIIVVQAIELTRRHKLRGYDAVHLACALFMRDTLHHQGLPSPIILSADQELLIAAQAEGLDVDDPNAHG